MAREAPNGKTPLAVISQEMKLKPEITTMAIGWLARENKIHLNSVSKTTYVHLTEVEVKKYSSAVSAAINTVM